LQIVNGKARLIKESYCDGLGACLGECPTGALHIVELEVEAYDEAAVVAHLKQTAPEGLEQHLAHLLPEIPDTVPLTSAQGMPACPSTSELRWEGQTDPLPAVRPGYPVPSPGPCAMGRTSGPGRGAARAGGAPRAACFAQRSELRQWPVQLHLVPAQAPFFRNADLVLIADCVPFAYPNLHADYIKGSAIAVGCPKLDDSSAYVVKLADILRNSDVKSLKVVYMEVPCCRGLVYIAQRAMQRAEKAVPFGTVMISIGD
jgi:ferredoxin